MKLFILKGKDWINYGAFVVQILNFIKNVWTFFAQKEYYVCRKYFLTKNVKNF